MSRLRRSIALALVASLAAPATATAASSAVIGTDDKAIAETLFFAGRGLMEAGRYEEACAKFTESYRLDPAGGTLLNLAVCHEKVGKIASAWGEYRRAGADAKKSGRLDRFEFAEEQAKLLEPELPYLKIEVPAAARLKGLEILRNGRALESAAWDTELPVDPGVVELTVRAPGFREHRATLTIARKEHRALAIPLLERLPPESPPVKVVERGWSTTRAVGASVFLVGLASAGLGVYFTVRAADAKRRSDDACPSYDGELRCTAEGVRAMKSANTSAWLANGSTALAVVGVGLGAYLFVIGGQKSDGLRVGLAASPFGVSGSLSGAF